MKLILPAIIVLIICCCCSCSSSKKTSTVIPVVPGSILSLPDSLPSLPSSEINLEIQLLAAPILAKADLLVPKEFISDGWPNYAQPSCDFRYKYRFIRSGMKVGCVNNKVAIQFTGNYQVAGSKCLCSMNKPITPWISGSCGFGNEPLRKIDINIASQFSFQDNYQLHSTTAFSGIKPIDKCQVSLFSNDITQLIADSVKASVTSFCSTLDQTISEMKFASLISMATEKSFQKIEMGKYGYLLINPSVISAGKLNFVKDSFRINVGTVCKPAFTSDSTNYILNATLPPLGQNDNSKKVSNVYLGIRYDYHFLSRVLSDTLKNKVVEIKGRTVVIKGVSVKSGGGHQIEIRIDFAGSNKGSIYLRGTPLLDTAKQALTIPDITYSLESNDLALTIAKSLFRNKIRKTLQGSSYLDVAALVKANLAALDKQLNRPVATNVYSAGKISELKIIGLLAKKDEIELQLFATATLWLSASGLP